MCVDTNGSLNLFVRKDVRKAEDIQRRRSRNLCRILGNNKVTVWLSISADAQGKTP